VQLTKLVRIPGGLLRRHAARALRGAAGAAAVLAITFATGEASAQLVDFNTTHTLFHESPTKTNMTVYTPGVNLQASPWEWLDVRGGWEADVVSGASVAVKAGPAYARTHPGVDVVTQASVVDLRNVAKGGFSLKKETVTLTGGYSYSTEHDYKSHAFSVAARTEPYDRNTQLEISYSRNFDRVCDRVQSTSSNSGAIRYRALEDSKGCFTDDALRTTRSVDIDAYQAGWSQAWTPTIVTQLIYTGELLHGFQSNPYRSVILGEGLKAQEHFPENRLRHALAARANIYIRPLKAALRLGLRGYWDTWDVASGSLEAEFEKNFGESLRLMARGRVYKQTGALFWSDDYTGGDRPLGPKGQYWAGDRELSPFYNLLAGVRAVYTIAPQKRILGLMSSLKFGASLDMIVFHYEDYTLGGEEIQDARAYLGSLSLTALF
jgi:hypothetical protein